MLFDLLDEDDDGLISLSDLKRIARTCYMQSMSLKDECEKVLNSIISEDQALDKKSAIQLLLRNRDAKAIFSSILQVY